MWKALIAVAAAAVVAGSSLVFAQQPPATGAAIHPGGEYGHEDYDLQKMIKTTVGSTLQNMTKKMVHIGSRQQKI